MTDRGRRLAILTAEEIDELYGPPSFSDADRSLYLDLTESEKPLLRARTGSVALYSMLMVGYFKAKRQFVDPLPPASHPDVRYLLERHFSVRVRDTLAPPSKPARLAIEQRILQAYGFRRCDKEVRGVLLARLQRLARHSTQPRYLLREALDHLERERIVLPAYTTLQDLIGHAVNAERIRLTEQLDATLTPAIRTQLDSLLQADTSTLDLRALRHEPNDFSLKALKEELERRRFFQPLHVFAEQFLSTAQVSKESGKYYASLVLYYTVYKLQRMEPATARLYLLCFAYHRFRRINDHLIEAFMAKVESYEQAAKQASEEAMQQALQEASEHLEAAGQVLQLFVDDRFSDDTTFERVKATAFTYLKPEQFSLVADYMRNIAFDKLGFQWAYYTTLSMAFKRNLRQLFIDLSFEGRVEHAPLMAAVEFLQGHLLQGRSLRQISPDAFPTELISKKLRRYLYPGSAKGKSGPLDIDRYEFLVYRLLCDALEGGNLYVRDSHEFRQFEDDLISDERWCDKEAVLREVDLPLLSAPIADTLAQLHTDNEAMFIEVNARITAGDNDHITIRGKGDKRRWTLAYPTAEESLNHPFFASMPGIGIADLLWFVARETGFLTTFTHVLERYVKQAPDPREILACIVALGTNMGLRKMAEVSGLNYASLLNTTRSFLRQETLHATNDAISNATARLSAFPLFHIRDEVHSSSDGQRIETQIDTINARHSPKYFGLHKGVSAYTVVANHIPINGKVIGTHEHESHYVFDLLYNNTTDIKPDRHSTDTHGTNQVNFWVLHAFGYRFAPRYRDLHKKVDTLVGARNPSHYGEILIKPARKCQDELIINEWPNIQRIMASLAQKDVTQSTIIRKLSSYKRQNQTKKALWELDNLIRTRYILSYIDDAGLRQSVQKALNRGEAYHRFRRAIAYVNGGKFRVQTEAEQQIWNDCSRLIANAIIYYNTALLSRVYDQKRAAGDEEAVAMLTGVSPAAWQNVNLFGSFEFSPTESLIDLDVMASYLVDWTSQGNQTRNSEI